MIRFGAMGNPKGSPFASVTMPRILTILKGGKMGRWEG